MNRTKIEWTDFSWNPITGCRGRYGVPCWYCYAKKLAERFPKVFPNGFEPTFHPHRLFEPWNRKKLAKIFVCSIADLFAPWTKKHWRDQVILNTFCCPIKHTFQMLTKHPQRIPKELLFPDNVWIGTTVTGEDDDDVNINHIKQVKATIRFVSFEPLLDEIDLDTYTLEGIQWVIIGKLTGSNRVQLDRAWVADIMEECDRLKIPYFLKNNLGLLKPPQHFPKVKA